MTTKLTIQQLGEFLIESPVPGAVTDCRVAGLFEQQRPNVHNAWTYVIPAMAKVARASGKKTFFGGDKGAKPYDEFLKKLRLVLIGLYADGVVSPGSKPEDCLYELVGSLAAFKTAYPNWQDAYSFGHKQFVENRDAALRLMASLQQGARGFTTG